MWGAFGPVVPEVLPNLKFWRIKLQYLELNPAVPRPGRASRLHAGPGFAGFAGKPERGMICARETKPQGKLEQEETQHGLFRDAQAG